MDGDRIFGKGKRFQAVLTVCKYVFAVFCLMAVCGWCYELYRYGFVWNVFAVYAKAFLMLLFLGLFADYSLRRI